MSIQILSGNCRLANIALPFLYCTLMFLGCSSLRTSPTNEGTSQTLGPSTTPPFATQEPFRYQAVRTITSSSTGSDETRITRSKISRDGSMRREEYETATGDVLVYLEIPAGRFVLLPAVRLFADLQDESFTSPDVTQSPQEADLSADRLLNQTIVETRYERLGTETINGHIATKYRVLPRVEARPTLATGETLIWVDETVKMPVKWETLSGESQTKTVMELSAISLSVEAGVFALPANYRKVNSQALQGRIGGGEQRPNAVNGKK